MNNRLPHLFICLYAEVQGHFSLKEAGETSGFMANMNENGRKEYEQPKIKVVMINTADIIATSDDPEGETDPWGKG